MSLTKPSDYKGTVALSQEKFDRIKLQDYLDELEKVYLQDLLGCELYSLLQAALDADTPPVIPRFLTIYDPFCFDVTSFSYSYGAFDYGYYDEYYCVNRLNRSRGLVDMLKGFMFFEYTRFQQQQNTGAGTSKSKGVASEIIGAGNTAAVKNYNASLVDYWNIQYYICQNLDIYPEFKGVIKKPVSFL